MAASRGRVGVVALCIPRQLRLPGMASTMLPGLSGGCFTGSVASVPLSPPALLPEHPRVTLHPPAAGVRARRGCRGG